MTDQTAALDPLEEAYARVRLRRQRGKPARPAAPGVGLAARKALRSLDAPTGSPLTTIKARWSEIVGERLAAVTRPEKISGGGASRTLTLRVAPAAAPLVQHQSETLRQRLSVAAGGTIAKIKIVQGAVGSAGAAGRPQRRAVGAAERAELEARASGVDNQRLRDAIVALGAAMLSREG
ncbi:MAG: DciA family protein [Pseudomonadota bacterium]